MQLASWRFHLMVLFATLLVAGSFLASDRLAGIVNPVSLTLLRFIGSVMLLAPLVMSRAKWRRAIVPTMPRALAISFFYALFFICLFESLNYTSSLNTSTLYTLVPMTTALLCLLLFGERIGRVRTVVYLLGGLGTLWVIFGGELTRLLNFSLNRGDLIFLVGALSMCCYSIAMKWLYRQDAMPVLVFCTLLGGALWMGAALLLFDLPLNWQRLEGGALGAMAYLVIGATLMTVFLYQRATVALGPSRVMSYIYLSPAAVALMLYLIEGIVPATQVMPGIIVSVMATLLLQYRSGQSARAD